MKKTTNLFFSLMLLTVLVSPSFSFINPVVAAEKSLDEKVESLIKGRDYDANSIIIVKKTSEKLQNDKKSFYADFKNIKIGASVNSEQSDVKKAESRDEVDLVKSEIKKALKDSSVSFVQPNYIYKSDWINPTGTTSIPSDYNTTNHWYYTKEKLPELWKDQGCPSVTCGGSNNIVVAVIDSGVAFEAFDDTAGYSGKNYGASSELSSINLWTNTAETPNDGLDNDCNGVVDDYHGIDTYTFSSKQNYASTCTSNNTPISVPASYRKSGHPTDVYGHGSYVTGLISSATNNGAGSVSPAFNVKIMPIGANTYFTNSLTSTSIGLGISYATYYGANVINMSLGFNVGYVDPMISSMIDSAIASNIVVVASTGNDSSSMTMVPVNFPASHKDVIAVGSVNPNNSRSSYSNGGANLSVTAYVGDVQAVGTATWQNTLSCAGCSITSNYTIYSEKAWVGTSFAAPQVAALAALVKSKNINLKPYQVKQLIEANAQDLGATGFDNETGFGAIDFQKTLQNTPVDSTVPVYRFFNRINGNHHFTIDENEKSYITNNIEEAWNPEGIAYTVFTYAKSGTVPVYRFHNKINDEHFFTKSTTERDYLDSNPDWSNEGTAFYLYPTDPGGKLPVYRLLNNYNGLHLYTTDLNEKDVLVGTGEWNYEGIQYYVEPYTGIQPMPAFRFYNSKANMHLYTSNVDERNNVLKLSDWYYEGTVFYVENTSSGTNVAARRFGSKTSAAHIYTTSPGEISYLQGSNSGWNDEGIAFYVNSSQKVGNLAIYRFKNKSNGDYVFVQNAIDVNTFSNNSLYTNEGVQYYGYLR